MNASILINFIKRAVVVPIILTAITICGVYVFDYNESGKQSTTPKSTPVYNVQEFEMFSQLEEGSYVGKLRSESLNFSSDITAFESVSSSLVLNESSKEPWKNGSVILIGTSAKNQLAVFRGAKKGDKLSLEIYVNDKLEYTITDIEYGLHYEELEKLSGKDKLFVCRSYNDFSNLSKSKLYAVYSAEKEGGV